MADAKQGAQAQTTEKVLEKSSLLDQMVDKARIGKDEKARERGRDLIGTFVEQVLEGHMSLTSDAEGMINARIAQIDKLLSAQLNEILHTPAFQKLEGTTTCVPDGPGRNLTG